MNKEETLSNAIEATEKAIELIGLLLYDVEPYKTLKTAYKHVEPINGWILEHITNLETAQSALQETSRRLLMISWSIRRIGWDGIYKIRMEGNDEGRT